MINTSRAVVMSVWWIYSQAQAARSNMDQIRQQCRERRRQRKSLQSYLGMLDNEVAKQDAIIAAPPKILELRSKVG